MAFSINKFSIISLVNINDPVLHIHINMNIEIITPSSDYHVFITHQAVYHTRPCNCVELHDHLQHRICSRFSISWMGILSLVFVFYHIAVNFLNICIPNYKIILYITSLYHPFIWLWSSSFKFFATKHTCNSNLSLIHWCFSWVILLGGYMCIQQLYAVILEFMVLL